MKIDAFSHITPEGYWKAVCKKYSSLKNNPISRMSIDNKLRTMERTPDVLQVLSNPTIPPVEALMTPADSIELSRILNDELAEAVVKYPDKFLGAVASLPKDIDAALEETDRAIKQLKCKGVLLITSLMGERLDDPKYRPLFEKMAKYDLPIWIHPCNSPNSENNEVLKNLESLPCGLFAWPLATANCMMRLVTAGIFNDFPNLKIITHHCGGVVPLLEGRVKWLMSHAFEAGHPAHKWKEHLRLFYNDTATMGTTSAIMCGYEFFGPDRLLFGSDGLTYETVRAVERMNIPDKDKDKIFYQNTIDILKIPV